MTASARLRRAVAGLLGVGALTACVAIPTSGPVTAGEVGLPPEQDGIVVLAQGPQRGADPAGIVEGFLFAADAEVTTNFDTTREFLAPVARPVWNPGAETVVARSWKVEQTGDAQVAVAVAVTAKVDAEGRYREVPADAIETLRFELVQDAGGDWRISHAPDVLVVSARRFAQQFREARVYFLTRDERMLVPEARWFRDLNAPTAVVQALLAGPSPWLRDAVTTAVPPETVLKPEAVSVEAGGVAEMVLGPEAAVLDADRGLLLAQLTQSLRSVGVSAVRVRAGAGGALLKDAQAPLTRIEPSTLEVLVDGQAMTIGDDGPVPVEGVRPVVGTRPSGAARSADGSVRVALADPSTLVTVPSGGTEQRTLLTGRALVAPSVDRYAWVWTARADRRGTLDAVRQDGAVVEVPVDWLAERRVEALRVSRDGTRVAVVSSGPEGVSLDVAGVRRDDAGTPVTIGPPLRAGAAVTPGSSVVWVDDATLGVLAQDEAGATPYLVPVSGSSTPLPAVADAVALAADRSERTLHVVTSQGDLLRHEGGTWVAVPGVTGQVRVTGASFPG